jgi:DNA-binding transcriptional LysR family regulator
VPYANRALELNEEALSSLREESASGPVRLGVSEDTALAGLTPALKRFQSSHPDIALEILVAEPAKLDLLLANGELDFAIGDPSSITGDPVMEWRTRPAWFASAELSLDAFQILPLVLWQGSSSWHDGILDVLRLTGWEWRVVFESGSLDASLAAVESGLGVAALPRETVRNSKGVAEIKQVRLPVLPEVQFGLFRSSAASSRAQGLMESALTASLRATTASKIPLGSYAKPPLPASDSIPVLHKQF